MYTNEIRRVKGMIHSSGKRRRYKRYLSMFIAFVMVCSVFIPAFAKSAGNGADGDEAAKMSAAITYEFYSDGELYDSQTVKDGETLKEPSEPDKDGSTFEGWYTSKDGGSKFTDFSKQSVTESKTVKLYARWQEAEESEPETESVESDSDKGTSDDATENSEEVSDGQEVSGDKDTTSDKADASDDKNSENVSASEEDDKKDVSDTDKENVSADQSENVDSETDEEEVSEPSESSDGKKEDAAADDTEKPEEDSDKEKNDTENVTDEKSEVADSADTSDGTAKKEENVANIQPQLSLNTGISPLAISGSETVAVGATITLTGGGEWFGRSHQWTASPEGKVTLSDANSSAVKVTGREKGTVTLTHRYYQPGFAGGSWETETYTITVTEASSEQSYDLYTYTLIPGKTTESTGTADQIWNGMGIGRILGLGSPDVHNANEMLDNGYGSNGAKITYPTSYPDITVDGETYQYADTPEEESLKGYYTITWFRVVVDSGANAGHNNYNQPVINGKKTFHLDGYITLNEENQYTVDFKLKDADEQSFEPVEPEKYTKRVQEGFAANQLSIPNETEPNVYPQTKIVNGITYTFDGWYLDEQCTDKVDFVTYTIKANTTFYARYIPETQDITVEKQVVTTSQADLTKEFIFNCEYIDASGEKQTVKLELHNDERDTIANVPVGTALKLTETNARGYDTSATYGDVQISASETTDDTRTMTVNTRADGGKIVVTNQKQGKQIDEDENFIIVEKKFTGITADQIPSNFQITVSGSGQSYSLMKDNHNWTQMTDSDGSIIWRWKISGVGTGNYTVSEENEEITDYTVTTTGDNGNVTVEAAEVAINKEKYETSCSTTNWPVGVAGNENFLFASALTSKSSIVISAEPLSASVRAAVAQYINDNFSGNWHDPIQFYSVSTDGYEYTIDGKLFTYDPVEGEIVIAEKSNWSHVASLSYDVTEASNPEIAITNAYEKNTSSITVKKLVTGNLSDYDKEFAFTASWRGSDGKQKTGNFSLKHDGSKELANLPVGTQVTISENRDDYELVSIKQGNAELPDSAITSDGKNSSCTVTVTNDPMTITFTNEKEAIVDVGIHMDNLPYILMLALVAGGAAAVLILCRRRG